MKTATKKIVLTKKGDVSKNIKNAINHCRFGIGKIYTGYYSGSGRFTTRHSAMRDVVAILESQGYKFEIGNDSEKGGASGEFIKCSKIAIQFIKSLK